MKLTKLLSFLLIICLLFAIPEIGNAVPMHWDHPDGSKYTSSEWPLPTAETPTYGFLNVATPSISVVASVTTVVGTLPAGTNQIEIWAFDGDINYGYSTVSSTTYNAFIASGTFKAFTLATSTPEIYLIARTATSTDVFTARILAK